MSLEEWKAEHSAPEYELKQIDFADKGGLFHTREMKMGQMSDVYTVFWNDEKVIDTILMESAFVYWNIYKNPKGGTDMAKTKENVETVEEKKTESKEEIFNEYLRKTKREGIEDLIDYLFQEGFYQAPASGGNHMAKAGGLLEHSLNVLQVAEKLSVALLGGKNITDEMRNSIVISCLLHDIGKMGDFGKQMYVENILKTTKKISEKKPYKRNTELSAVPHAVRSVKLATLFIDLTEEEEWAILTHDGMYDYAKTFLQGHESQLFMILHWADMWASRVIEGGSEDEDANN